MRLSRDYFFTLREDVKDEDSNSGNLLVRAGMVKKSSSGVYMMLPAGLKVLRKIEAIVREEMNAIDSLEVAMPSLIPEDVYVASGRRETFGNGMFSLRDRFNKPFVLGPTHEELFAVAAQMHIRSYKNLPASLYQIKTKFRDEPRPRYGLIRVREFTMKDSYTFDVDLAGLDHAYQLMFDAYKRIFDRLCLNYVIVTADTGVMGGLLSEEFQALSPIGEDILVIEENSGYSSNLEVAACVLEGEMPDEESRPYQMVFTPESRTIEEVVDYLKRPASDFVKTLIYNIDGKLYALMVRGDHEVNETKVSKLLKANEIVLASPAEVEEATGAPIGFAGPVGVKVPVIMDQQLTVMKNFIVGANKADHHLIDVNLEDFKAQVADIRKIKEGDLCENGQGRVVFRRGIEVGNTFKLGTKYSEAMNLYYLDEHNQQKPCYMGSYGIGIERCMAAIVEQYHDEKGILWPKHLAPYQVGIVVVNPHDEEQLAVGNKIYADLQKTGLDVLIDDRNERAGVKFNDMELIGVYARITIGRSLADGNVELKIQRQEDTTLIPCDQIVEEITKVFA